MCTLNYCPSMVQYRLKNEFSKDSLTRSFTVTERVNGATNFMSMVSNIPLVRRRRYDPVITERTIT